MYERIEKCEVKRKDWNIFLFLSLSRLLIEIGGGGGDAETKRASKWKILMFNQLLMSELCCYIILPFRSSSHTFHFAL